MSDLTYHPFDDDRPRKFWSSQSGGAWHKLVDWLAGDDEAEADRYELIEMFTDDESIEVVTRDGEPVGVLDNSSIGLADLARFETYEEMELREGREDAERELMDDVRKEARDV